MTDLDALRRVAIGVVLAAVIGIVATPTYLAAFGWRRGVASRPTTTHLIGGAGMLATGLRTAVTERIIPEVAGFADLLIVLGIVAGLLAVQLWTAPSAATG